MNTLIKKAGTLSFAVAVFCLCSGFFGSKSGGGSKLEINSEPEKAEVFVNGKSKGTTPVNLSGVQPGAYTVELRKEGFERAYRKIALLEGQDAAMNIELNRLTGLLLVTSEPPGSEVVIDNEVRGTTPALLTELPLGEYKVEIRSAGLPSSYATAKLLDRTPVSISVCHPPRIAVNSYPPGAEISVDGAASGKAPIVLEDISEGDHLIVAKLAGYDTQEQAVFLKPGMNDAVEFNLDKNSGTLVLDTEPAGVQVYVGGELFATTQPKDGIDTMSQPLRIALKAGVDHQIQLVREGYSSSSLTVNTEIDQITTKHEVLKRIFVRDTRITTKKEVIDCRLEYKLPNGNYYYERMPGIYDTAKAADITKVEPISLDDKVNEAARKLIEQNKSVVPE